jgi:hypothetical protein
MTPPSPPDKHAPDATQRKSPRRAAHKKKWALVASIAAVVLWLHFGSGLPVFHSHVAAEPGWERFRADYRLDSFGHDGQFVRAVQNGYNLVFHTTKYAARFTRRAERDGVNSCSACHTAEDLAYGFVNSDRFDRKLGRRISFEERVQRCYANSMEGYIPTIYDPAVRDIRLLARAIAHHLQLTEGAQRKGR